ncbi:SELT2 protein, partial [Polypterus senegalus]
MAEYNQTGLMVALILFTVLTVRDIYLGKTTVQLQEAKDSRGLKPEKQEEKEPHIAAKQRLYSGPVLKFQYCRVFEEYSRTISQLYPDIRIEGGNYPPKPTNSNMIETQLLSTGAFEIFLNVFLSVPASPRMLLYAVSFVLQDMQRKEWMTLEIKKRKRVRAEPRIKWCTLKKEDCKVEFREKLIQALGGSEESWETTADVVRVTARGVLGVTSGQRKEEKETWWWNGEVQESIQRKRMAKKKWDIQRDAECRQEYKEIRHKVKREVAKAKEKAYDEL